MMASMKEIWTILRAGETIEINLEHGITVWSGVNAVSAAYDPDAVIDPVAMVADLLARARDPASFDMDTEPPPARGGETWARVVGGDWHLLAKQGWAWCGHVPGREWDARRETIGAAGVSDGVHVCGSCRAAAEAPHPGDAPTAP